MSFRHISSIRPLSLIKLPGKLAMRSFNGFLFIKLVIDQYSFFYRLAAGIYASLYNTVNYPAGSMPVTKVTAEDVDSLKTYPQRTYMEKVIVKVPVTILFFLYQLFNNILL